MYYIFEVKLKIILEFTEESMKTQLSKMKGNIGLPWWSSGWLHAPKAGGPGWILGQGIGSHMPRLGSGAAKKEKENEEEKNRKWALEISLPLEAGRELSWPWQFRTSPILSLSDYPKDVDRN